MANPLLRGFVWLFFERKSGKKSYPKIKSILESNAQIITDRMTSCVQNNKNHETITHIIGMERWMQSRIKVALGEPFVQEEYDNYRPARDTDWDTLTQAFIDTRQVSCDLCTELQSQNISPATKVNHNQFGELTIGAWLEYLDFHSSLTSRAV